MMANGTTSSLWFRLLNLAKVGVADLRGWIVEAWSTPSSTWCARAVPGGCCPATLVLGRRSMAAFGAGARIGLGPSFTTRCETTCARPKSARWHRRPPLSTASRSRSPTSGRARLRRGKKGVGTQTPRGGGLPRIDFGDYDHTGRYAGPRCRQRPDQIAGGHVWTIADHLGRWWLSGSFG